MFWKHIWRNCLETTRHVRNMCNLFLFFSRIFFYQQQLPAVELKTYFLECDHFKLLRIRYRCFMVALNKKKKKQCWNCTAFLLKNLGLLIFHLRNIFINWWKDILGSSWGYFTKVVLYKLYFGYQIWLKKWDSGISQWSSSSSWET